MRLLRRLVPPDGPPHCMPLITAVDCNRCRICSLQVDGGADLGVRDYRDYTPPMAAGRANLLEIAELLLENSAVPHTDTVLFWEASELALRENDGQLVESMITVVVGRR